MPIIKPCGIAVQVVMTLIFAMNVLSKIFINTTKYTYTNSMPLQIGISHIVMPVGFPSQIQMVFSSNVQCVRTTACAIHIKHSKYIKEVCVKQYTKDVG